LMLDYEFSMSSSWYFWDTGKKSYSISWCGIVYQLCFVITTNLVCGAIWLVIPRFTSLNPYRIR
jgi:hypothetical protein